MLILLYDPSFGKQDQGGELEMDEFMNMIFSSESALDVNMKDIPGSVPFAFSHSLRALPQVG